MLANGVSGQDDSRKPERWEKTIAAFEKQDKAKPPPENAILFVGSSSIRMWKLGKYFPDLKTINRGFGGSEMADVLHFTPRIVLKYKPRTIVVYEGDNDISHGKTPEQLRKEVEDFVKMVRAVLSDVKIIFLAVKPSLSRWQLADVQRQANAKIESYCQKNKNLVFVDVFQPMLGDDGRPRPELFAKDGLHLNHTGYQLWTKLLRPHLK